MKNLNAPRPSEHPPVWGKTYYYTYKKLRRSRCVLIFLCSQNAPRPSLSILFILDVRFFVDVPAGVTQEEDYTGFFIHLPSAVLA